MARMTQVRIDLRKGDEWIHWWTGDEFYSQHRVMDILFQLLQDDIDEFRCKLVIPGPNDPHDQPLNDPE